MRQSFWLNAVSNRGFANKLLQHNLSDIADCPQREEILLRAVINCDSEQILPLFARRHFFTILDYSNYSEIFKTVAERSGKSAATVLPRELNRLPDSCFRNKGELILAGVRDKLIAAELVKKNFELLAAMPQRESTLLLAVRVSSDAAASLVYRRIPAISDYRNREAIVLAAVTHDDAAVNFSPPSEWVRAAPGSWSVHFKEISDYSNKGEIVAQVVSSKKAAKTFFVYSGLTKEIQDYADREEIEVIGLSHFEVVKSLFRGGSHDIERVGRRRFSGRAFEAFQKLSAIYEQDSTVFRQMTPLEYERVHSGLFEEEQFNLAKLRRLQKSAWANEEAELFEQLGKLFGEESLFKFLSDVYGLSSLHDYGEGDEFRCRVLLNLAKFRNDQESLRGVFGFVLRHGSDPGFILRGAQERIHRSFMWAIDHFEEEWFEEFKRKKFFDSLDRFERAVRGRLALERIKEERGGAYHYCSERELDKIATYPNRAEYN